MKSPNGSHTQVTIYIAQKDLKLLSVVEYKHVKCDVATLNTFGVTGIQHFCYICCVILFLRFRYTVEEHSGEILAPGSEYM